MSYDIVFIILVLCWTVLTADAWRRHHKRRLKAQLKRSRVKEEDLDNPE